jgi:UDPglucose--hexose-1-phosphate uridylyltransferase
MITFEKTEKHSTILNPLKDFHEEAVCLEYRTDPLTGRNTTVIKGMLDYISKFLVSDEKLLSRLIEKTRATCPFCPESVKTKTPMFPPDFLKEGRISVGDAVVVPNLLGHAERSILVILSKEHHLKLKDFTSKLVLDGFKGGVAYLRKLAEVKPSIRFPAVIFNYLPPAGSSIFHPHMQVLARDRPFYLVKLLLEKSKLYYEKNQSNYWADLLAKEKENDRYLFERNGAEWFIPFAPLRGLNEIQAVVPGRSSLLELTNKEWLGLAEGVSTILQFYHKQGYISFNIIFMSGPLNEHLNYFDVSLRIISRPGVQASSFTDAWALPYLLWDGEAVEEPEQLAARLKPFISSVLG